MTIHGFEEIDPEDIGRHHPFASLAGTTDEWRQVFGTSLHRIRHFLSIHDRFAVLAKCTNLAAASAAFQGENPHWVLEKYEPYQLIGSAELEVLQAFTLMEASPCRSTPASPGSMQRFLAEPPKCTYAFSRMQLPRYPDDPEREILINRIRLQTIHYRNLFMKDDAEAVILSIFSRIDQLSTTELGFAFSEMFLALVAVASKIEKRLDEFRDKIKERIQAKSEAEALSSIEFFCAISPAARRAWTTCKRRCVRLDELRMGAFQLSELCHTWPYKLDRSHLKAEFGERVLTFFESISIRPGELASANLEHFFMNNPVWRRPFVAFDDCNLFLPLPQLLYGFPFQIMEQFLAGRPALERAYSDARARFLEETIEAHVSTAMPSARIYRDVEWRDTETNTLYGNDVVAVIGNTIFVFEAKSGRLDEVARRGGELRTCLSRALLMAIAG